VKFIFGNIFMALGALEGILATSQGRYMLACAHIIGGAIIIAGDSL